MSHFLRFAFAAFIGVMVFSSVAAAGPTPTYEQVCKVVDVPITGCGWTVKQTVCETRCYLTGFRDPSVGRVPCGDLMSVLNRGTWGGKTTTHAPDWGSWSGKKRGIPYDVRMANPVGKHLELRFGNTRDMPAVPVFEFGYRQVPNKTDKWFSAPGAMRAPVIRLDRVFLPAHGPYANVVVSGITTHTTKPSVLAMLGDRGKSALIAAGVYGRNPVPHLLSSMLPDSTRFALGKGKWSYPKNRAGWLAADFRPASARWKSEQDSKARELHGLASPFCTATGFVGPECPPTGQAFALAESYSPGFGGGY